MIEPDLRTWANRIIFMLREGMPASDKLVDAVEHELQEIAAKYFQLGDRDCWWQEQDEEE